MTTAKRTPPTIGQTRRGFVRSPFRRQYAAPPMPTAKQTQNKITPVWPSPVDPGGHGVVARRTDRTARVLDRGLFVVEFPLGGGPSLKEGQPVFACDISHRRAARKVGGAGADEQQRAVGMCDLDQAKAAGR